MFFKKWVNSVIFLGFLAVGIPAQAEQRTFTIEDLQRCAEVGLSLQNIIEQELQSQESDAEDSEDSDGVPKNLAPGGGNAGGC